MAELEALRKENAGLRARLRDIEAARASDQLYERSPLAYLCLDRIGRILYANPAGAAMLGADPSRIAGSLFTHYLATESRNRFLMHLYACRQARHAASEFDLHLQTRSVEMRVDVISVPERSNVLRCHTVMVPSSLRTRLAALLPDKNARDDLAWVAPVLEAQQDRFALQNRRLKMTQHLLEESCDRYALLYEFSPVGYLSLDEAGYVHALNLTAAVMLGTGRTEVTGRSLARYLAERDIGRYEAHLGACRAGAPQVKSELTLSTPTGSREVELVSVRIEAENREVVLYHTAMMDITDRKHALEAVRDSESKLRWLIDNMPAVLWIQDETGGPRYVSANVVQMLGYTEHEVRSGGAHFWSANIHPDDQGRVRAAYARMFGCETGAAGAYDIEYRRQAKDGGWVWVVDRGMSMSYENGIRYATGMLWDTTRRKRMQEQLRESEERFRQLAENIDDVFFLMDVDGSRIFYVSPAFERLWGFSAEKVYADPAAWLKLVHMADRKRVRRALKGRRAGAAYDIEFRIRRADGAVRWIRMRGFPIREADGRVSRFAGIAADITVRKEAADTLRHSHQRMRELALHLESAREEERKRIAREIHDDLGALLLAIKMDLEASRKAMMSGRPASDINMDSIGRVDMAIESVRRMATDLRPSILDQLGVLAAVEWQAQDVERRTGISCHVELDAGKDQLAIDSERATAIFRIVQESLANVVRHSGATQVKIALHEQAGSVELQISDNGRGFGADAADASDLPKWGLIGMAERVASFGGRFDVMPTQPHGTTVSVWIPAARHRSTRAAGKAVQDKR